MAEEERIALECPYCGGQIFRPLAWFRQSYFNCPACGGGLCADQFAVRIAELDEAFETCVAEMVHGKPGCSCKCRES